MSTSGIPVLPPLKIPTTAAPVAAAERRTALHPAIRQLLEQRFASMDPSNKMYAAAREMLAHDDILRGGGTPPAASAIQALIPMLQKASQEGQAGARADVALDAASAAVSDVVKLRGQLDALEVEVRALRAQLLTFPTQVTESLKEHFASVPADVVKAVQAFFHDDKPAG